MSKVTADRSVSRKVTHRVLAGGERAWSVSDFDDLGTPDAINSALRRLVEDEQLRRVRRGVYWRGRESKFGMTPTPGHAVVREVLGDQEAIGAAEWSATNALGLSTQVPRQLTLAISTRSPRNLPRDVKVVRRDARRGRRTLGLNEAEVTLLEALDAWDRYVEVPADEALDCFARALRSREVRLDRVVRASATEPPAVRERLRAVLQYAGHTHAAGRVPRARDKRTADKALRVLVG